ncbi:MAG: BTAD domain-containing putative transcriptional regulator [Mycobacteriales bacterium]
MRVRLLGPVDVAVDGQSRPVSGLRRKALLAVLALHHREVVGIDRLIDVVWADDAPSTVLNTLQSHVSHLRTELADKAAIQARAPGYVLDLGEEAIDVEVAERLLRQARETTDRTRQASHLRAALALWRGRPLADITGLPALEEQAERLDRIRWQARQELVEARLALGEHVALVQELRRLVDDHPFDEQLNRLLMLALYRAGRQTEALATYHRLRRALDEDLGIDPGPALRELEAAILRQDPALAVPDAPAPTRAAVAAPAPAPVAPTRVPAQLPPATQGFTGRDDALAALDALLPPAGPGGAVVIAVVSGTAGVGKTALAVQWAHRVAHHYPDGQLYVNLRGFGPGPALDPAVAVRGFLDAFGVAVDAVDKLPADLAGQTGLYRSLLAGKRVLVVLDNARDVAQVRPLLPGGATSLVVVTSRDQLTPLVATEGAYPLPLELLSTAEARDLLARRLGTARTAAEPDAVEEIVTRCARLPLALAIASARAATRPRLPLAALATELSEAAGGLDPFHAGDTATDVRAVFSWSYRALNPAAARLFRLLGLHPGPDVTAPAAASLGGRGDHDTRLLLADLTSAHLLTEHVPGRYTFHDLLRAYAAELAAAIDSADIRAAATDRMLDHYTRTAAACATLLSPHWDPLPLTDPPRGVVPERIADGDAALAWLTAEHPVLVAAVAQAAGSGYDTHAWQLARTLVDYFERRGHWHDWTSTHRAGLDAARRLGDPLAAAQLHRGLGRAFMWQGRYDDAWNHFQQGLAEFQRLGDGYGQARTHHNLTQLAEMQGQHRTALSHAGQAMALCRVLGDKAGLAKELNAMGWCLALLGDHRQALVHCEEALAIQQELGDLSQQHATLDSIGYAHHHLGHHREAVERYRQALAISRELGDRYTQAKSLTHLGDAHLAGGDPGAAREAWRQALDIFTEIANVEAADVRARLQQTSEV